MKVIGSCMTAKAEEAPKDKLSCMDLAWMKKWKDRTIWKTNEWKGHQYAVEVKKNLIVASQRE